jgi:Protein of unknown function (DUF2778)
MTWRYQQSTGELTQDGIFEGTGYSGTGIGRNSPTMQDTADVGPVPVGQYTIESAIDSDKLGPCVMSLTPAVGDEMYGRSGFFIHGNNAANDASHGCIILGPSIRRMIASSADRTLVVIS